MKCPNCQHAMNIVEDPVARLEVCPNCGGTWFDQGELERMKDAELPDAQWLDVNLWKDVDALKYTWSEKPCPICSKLMAQVEYGETGVKVDICVEHHGVYLDKGEFEAILSALEEEISTMDSSDYLNKTVHEGRELINSPEGRQSEWKDFKTVFRLLGDRVMVENPTFARALAAFALGSPK